MYNWLAKVERELESTEIHGFLNRPVVTVGEGFVKISSLDREILQPSDGVTNVMVTSIEEDGLVSILEGADLDELMAKGLDLRDDGYELPGKIVVAVVKQVRLVKEVEEEYAGRE